MNDREYVWRLQEKGICKIHVKYTEGIGARTGLEKTTFHTRFDFLKHETTAGKPFTLIFFPEYTPLDIDFKALNEKEKGVLTAYLDTHPLFSKTRQHKTKSGGRHYLFKYSRNKVISGQQNTKVFAFNCLPEHPKGFIDVPWNLAFNDHPKCKYEVTNPSDPIEISDTDFENLGMSRVNADPLVLDVANGVEEGARHTTVFKLVSSLVAKGASDTKVFSFFSKIADRFHGGGFDLEKDVSAALKWCRENISERAKEIPLFDITQSGLADRVEHYMEKGKLLFNVTSGSWHIFSKWFWRDNVFTPLDTVRLLVKDKLELEFSVRAYNAIEPLEDEEEREKVWSAVWKMYGSHFRECQSKEFISAALDFLRDREGFSATEDLKSGGRPVFNQVYDRINFKNTSFCFKTFEPVPFDWRDLSTMFSPVEYDEKASCPKFEAMFSRIMGGDQELMQWLKCFLGSCLIGGTNTDKILPVFYGTGNNGKSTLIEILHYVMGDYSTSVHPEVLAYTKNRDKFGMDGLPNMRLVTAQESVANAKLDIGRVKSLTGNDTQTCERKHKKKFDFRPSFKIILSTNNRPKINDNGDAVWKRVRLVPFSVKIPDAEIIPELHLIIIKEESSGVVNWLIDGARQWVESGRKLPLCKAIDAASQEYQAEEDAVLQWKEERCDNHEDYASGASLSELYNDFKIMYYHMRRGEFKKALINMGYEPRQDMYNIVRFQLKLRSENGFTAVGEAPSDFDPPF